MIDTDAGNEAVDDALDRTLTSKVGEARRDARMIEPSVPVPCTDHFLVGQSR